jgi:putative solute:sodium symporter small subunit
MHDDRQQYEVNFFRPRKGFMTGEVLIILAVLVGWGVANFGFQAVLRLLAQTPDGQGIFTQLTFLSFPWHFWFTAQLLPLWFIILCVLFNVYIDRHTMRHSRRRDRSHD